MAKNDFQYGGWNSYTLQYATIITFILPHCRVQSLHPARWHVALESWQWIHQVAAPCNVIRGSGMTCHWIPPYVRHIRILHLVSISTTSLQSTCHFFCTSVQNFILIGPPMAEKMTSCRFSRWRLAAILDFGDQIMGSLKSPIKLTKLLSFPENRVFAFLRQDPRWRISVILDFMGPIMGSLKSPWPTAYRSSIDTVTLNCLAFEKIAFFAF